jgi:Family of unknown function (DUF5989)
MLRLRYLFRLLGEILAFARAHKAYWIVPMILVLALVFVLVVTSQGAAPFLYTLF